MTYDKRGYSGSRDRRGNGSVPEPASNSTLHLGDQGRTGHDQNKRPSTRWLRPKTPIRLQHGHNRDMAQRPVDAQVPRRRRDFVRESTASRTCPSRSTCRHQDCHLPPPPHPCCTPTLWGCETAVPHTHPYIHPDARHTHICAAIRTGVQTAIRTAIHTARQQRRRHSLGRKRESERERQYPLGTYVSSCKGATNRTRRQALPRCRQPLRDSCAVSCACGRVCGGGM